MGEDYNGMESKIEGLAKGLVEEVIKADMTMHASQIEAWAWMAKHRPKGDDIPREILEGLPKNRYLSVDEVSFDFSLKPLSMHSYWRRFLLGVKLMFGRKLLLPNGENAFEICDAKDSLSQKMTIHIKRLKSESTESKFQKNIETVQK